MNDYQSDYQFELQIFDDGLYVPYHKFADPGIGRAVAESIKAQSFRIVDLIKREAKPLPLKPPGLRGNHKGKPWVRDIEELARDYANFLLDRESGPAPVHVFPADKPTSLRFRYSLAKSLISGGARTDWLDLCYIRKNIHDVEKRASDKGYPFIDVDTAEFL